MNEYVSGSKASAILGVHQRTLYLWDDKKLIDVIRTPGGKRLYNVKKYLAELESNKAKEPSDDNAPKRNYSLKKKKDNNVVSSSLEQCASRNISPSKKDLNMVSIQNEITEPSIYGTSKRIYNFEKNNDTNILDLSIQNDITNSVISGSDDVSEKCQIKIKPLTEIKMSEIQKPTSINDNVFDKSPFVYKRRIEPNKKQNIIFTQNPSQQLINKYPSYTVLSGDTSLTTFLDLIIANKVNQIIVDKNDWNIDSYNMLLYLIIKFTDATIIAENNITYNNNNNSTDMQSLMKIMMSALTNKND